MKRANLPEQKEERKKVILKQARILYSKSGTIPKVSEIAHASGIAKGSVYSYFSSCESIFMEITSNMLEEWYVDSLQILDKKRIVTAKQMAFALTRYPLSNPVVFRLHAIKPQLERSLLTTEIEKYQTITAEWLTKAACNLELIENINSNNSIEILIQVYAMINGLWQINFDLLNRLKYNNKKLYDKKFDTTVIRSVEKILKIQ